MKFPLRDIRETEGSERRYIEHLAAVAQASICSEAYSIEQSNHMWKVGARRSFDSIKISGIERLHSFSSF